MADIYARYGVGRPGFQPPHPSSRPPSRDPQAVALRRERRPGALYGSRRGGRDDDEMCVRILATWRCPRLTIRLRPQEIEGAGKDRVHAAPAVSCALMHNKKCAHEHTGSAETLRPSLRNGFTTYTRSPWRPGFLVTITRVMRSIIARLTPTLGRQDHTLSPYASMPNVYGTNASTAACPNVSDVGRHPLLRDRMAP